jgi:hypothetical protein
MNQPGAVGRDQSAPGGQESAHHVAPGSVVVQPSGQGLAFDELHGHVHLLADGADLVDRDDVGVAEARHRLRLAQESTAILFRIDSEPIGPEDRDRDLAVEAAVVGRHDHAHPARAEPLQHGEAADRVAPAKR